MFVRFVLGVIVPCMLLVAGCMGDTSRLDERRCESDADCSGFGMGSICISGYCAFDPDASITLDVPVCETCDPEAETCCGGTTCCEADSCCIVEY